MEWSDGFSARYYATVVDPVTWRDMEMLDIISGSINITEDSLIESASLSVQNYDTSAERWIRVWLDARQKSDSYHGALFTGLATSPSYSIEGTTFKNDLTCYSVLKPADDVLLPYGWYISAGTNGAGTVQDLLSMIPAPIHIDDNSPNLSNTIVAESGESNLSMANKILYAIGWRFRIDGDGTINIIPNAVDTSASFDSIYNDCLETTVSVENDWFRCPNVFRASNNGVTAIARDDSEDSYFSTVNRGREIWMEEPSCYLMEGELVSEYAERRLKEEQQKNYKISYTRRYDPNVRCSDLIRIHYPAQLIDGIFYVSSQTISLGHGASVSETAFMV